jgi:hypothetical protein
MSLVAFASTSIDDNETSLVNYVEGAVFIATMDGSALGAGNVLTLEARTQVNQDSGVVVHTLGTINGATPADPACIRLGPIVTKEALELVAYLDDAVVVDCPWKLQQKGRVSTVENGEGTLTAPLAEDSLVSVPYGGTFVLLVDLSAMQAGDDVELRLKAKAGGPDSTAVVVVYELFEDVQTNKIAQLWIDVDESVEATLEQSAGSARSFPWAVVKVG